ncbi:MAG: KH domain-containing protein [Clostridia bacterium]|nr:KH domain-containing protein [Clostridia bacterium]
MEKSLNFIGKTVEEAIETGLKALGLPREAVEVEVLEEGKVRRIGKSVAAAVKLTILDKPKDAEEIEEKEEKVPSSSEESDGERAVKFLKGLFKELGEEVKPVLESEDEKIVINLQSDSAKGIIGRRGEVIDALQTLAGAVANTGRKSYVRVVVDFENYRERREETLQHVAEKYAAKAVRQGRKVRLEPMNPYERRIIHAALMDNPDVTTHSEGNEPARFVVITPKNVRYDKNGRGGRGDRNNRNNRGDKYGNKDRNGKPYPKRTLPQEGTPESSGTSLNRGSSYSRFFGSYLGNSRDEENNDEE